MKKFFACSLLALSTLSTAAMAATPSWNYVEGSYTTVDIDDTDGLDLNGFAIKGSKLFNDNVFGVAEYSLVSDSINGTDIDVTQFNAGVGYRYGLSNTTDFYGVLSYEYAKLEAGSEDSSDSGYSAKVGVRSMVTDMVELNANFGYYDIDSSDTAYEVGALYHLNKNFAAGISYKAFDDADMTSFTVRYSF